MHSSGGDFHAADFTAARFVQAGRPASAFGRGSRGCSRGRWCSCGGLAAGWSGFGVARAVERGVPLAGFKTVDFVAADHQYGHAHFPGELFELIQGCGIGLWVFAAEGHAAIGEQLACLVARCAACGDIQRDGGFFARGFGCIGFAAFNDASLE